MRTDNTSFALECADEETINDAYMRHAPTATKVSCRRMARNSAPFVTELNGNNDLVDDPLPMRRQNHLRKQNRDSTIDFSSAGIYLIIVQCGFTVACTSTVTILVPLMTRTTTRHSAIRTLVAQMLVAVYLLKSPWYVHRPVKGLYNIFNAMRPVVALLACATVVEEMSYSCSPVTANDNESRHAHAPDSEWYDIVRFVWYHVLCVTLLWSAAIRACKPMEDSDNATLLSAGVMLVTAILFPPAHDGASPLCSTPGILSSVELFVRSFLFCAVYSTHVYTAAPHSNVWDEVVICVFRAAAASVWLLVVAAYLLPLAPMQCAVVLWTRLRSTPFAACRDADVNTGIESDTHTSVDCGMRASDSEMIPLRESVTPKDSGSDNEGAEFDTHDGYDATVSAVAPSVLDNTALRQLFAGGVQVVSADGSRQAFGGGMQFRASTLSGGSKSDGTNSV